MGDMTEGMWVQKKLPPRLPYDPWVSHPDCPGPGS